MNKLFKLFAPIRIAISPSKCSTLLTITRGLTCHQSLSVLVCNLDNIGVRSMSQKNITSFFKITPKKVAEIKEEKQKDVESPINSSSEVEKSPISNGKEKRSSKRQRLESSESESESHKVSEQSTSPIRNEKKKLIKRQRIESSTSEAESHKSDAETEIKLEKTNTPRTYNSPKSKKREIKVEKSPLTEKNVEDAEENDESSLSSAKMSNSEAEEETSPSSKTESKVKESKNKTRSPATSSKAKKNAKGDEKKRKSPSPSNKVKKKTEVSRSKNTMSMFLKKDNGVSEAKDEEKKEEGSTVPEEEYNPAKSKYHPITDSCWVKEQPVPYLALAKTLEAIEATSARLKMIEILSNYLRSVLVLTPEDLLPSIYLCLNQLAPAYHSVELGIAETYLMKAVGSCTGRTLAQVRAAARAQGDLGRVAEAARACQRTMFAPPPLRLRQVFATLKEIANMTGQSSVNKKIAKIQTLYTACRYSEARYLIRSLEGKLRIGLAEQSVLQALALATALTPPGPDLGAVLDASKGLSPEQFKARLDEQALLIKTTYCECPNYELVVPALVAHGAAALPAHCRLTPGVPLKPMLAHPTKGLGEVFNRFEGAEFTCEWKYDGERAQVHVPGAGGGGAGGAEGEGAGAPDYGRAAVFSRNQENNTSKYPDILRRLPALLKDGVTSCVLDAEAVAYDTINKQILPFQILSTRKRKDAVEADIKVQVCVFVFDLLYLNGRALVREPLAVRRELLRKHFNEVEGEWQFATSKDCTSMEEVQQFLEESVRGSCEGLMVKMLRGEHARYDIARRSHNWLKLKKDYLEGVGDTIDAVVIGAWWGRGRRAGALGGFLLACRDAESDELQALCKIGTGFSDEDLQTLTGELQEHIIEAPRSYYRYDASHAPDVWVGAACVWEVRCADLSLSPAHRAAIGLVHPDKGISLRFPRFVRARTDKTPEQATSAQQIADMYLAQDQVKNQAPGARPHAHDDFY